MQFCDRFPSVLARWAWFWHQIMGELGRMIHEAGLAAKPVGPHGRRAFLAEKPDKPRVLDAVRFLRIMICAPQPLARQEGGQVSRSGRVIFGPLAQLAEPLTLNQLV